MRKFLLLLISLFFAAFSQAQKTYIWCGSLIDGVAGQPSKDKTIVVDKNMITEIRDGFVQGGKDDKIVDLKTKTVMPGLMDMHVHLEEETKKGGFADRFIENPADIAFESAKFAQTTLMSGFTTVRDLGGTGVNIALRNAINKGITI